MRHQTDYRRLNAWIQFNDEKTYFSVINSCLRLSQSWLKYSEIISTDYCDMGGFLVASCDWIWNMGVLMGVLQNSQNVGLSQQMWVPRNQTITDISVSVVIDGKNQRDDAKVSIIVYNPVSWPVRQPFWWMKPTALPDVVMRSSHTIIGLFCLSTLRFS